MKTSLRMPKVLEQVILDYIDPTEYVRCLKVLTGPIDEVPIPADCPAEFNRSSKWSSMRQKLRLLQWKFNLKDRDVDDIIQLKIDLLSKQDTRGWTLLGVDAVRYLETMFKCLREWLTTHATNVEGRSQTLRPKRERKDNTQQPEPAQPWIQEKKQRLSQDHPKELTKLMGFKSVLRDLLRKVWSWRTVESRDARRPFKFIVPVGPGPECQGSIWGVLTWESKKCAQEVPTITYYDAVGLFNIETVKYIDECVQYLSWYEGLDALYDSNLTDIGIDDSLAKAVYNITAKHTLWSFIGKSRLKSRSLVNNKEFALLETAYISTLTDETVPLPSVPVYRLSAPVIVLRARETRVYCTAIIHLLVSACSTLDRLRDDQGSEIARRLVFEVINNALYDPFSPPHPPPISFPHYYYSSSSSSSS